MVNEHDIQIRQFVTVVLRNSSVKLWGGRVDVEEMSIGDKLLVGDVVSVFTKVSMYAGLSVSIGTTSL